MSKPLFLLLLTLIGVLWFIVCFSGCSGVLFLFTYFLWGGVVIGWHREEKLQGEVDHSKSMCTLTEMCYMNCDTAQEPEISLSGSPASNTTKILNINFKHLADTEPDLC